MYELVQVNEMKQGDKVYYCNHSDFICICKVNSITMSNQIIITLDVIEQGDPLPLKYVRKLWGLKNLDIFKIEDIKVLTLEEDEDDILHSYWKVPGSVEGLVKYDYLDIHLFLYSRVAEVWIGDTEKQLSIYQFFHAFRKEENLSIMNWEDFQKLREQSSFLHTTLPLESFFCEQKAPIERYRQYFIDFLFGEDSIDKRLDSFYKDPVRKLIGFGHKEIGELVHYLFPKFFCRFTSKEIMAVERLFKEASTLKNTYTIGSKIYHYQKLIRESYLLNKYLNIVGRKTELPLHYEINCFLQYIYDTHSESDNGGIEEVAFKEREQKKYWIYTIQTGVETESFLEESMLTFTHGKLGNIRNYSSRKEIWNNYRQIYSSKKVPYIETSSLYQFCHEMEEGDLVFVKNDKEQFIGLGKVCSPYIFPKFPNSPSFRKIEWIQTGTWTVSGMLFSKKPLVNITANHNSLSFLLDKILEK